MTARCLGPWRLVEKIDSGGNGTVWRAEHDVSGAIAAVKEIKARKPQSERYRRFIAEISTLRALGEFKGVLGVLDSHLPDSPDEQPWLAMPLATPIREALEGQPLTGVVAAMGAVADTLARLAEEHAIAHRDVKPGNLFSREGRWLVGDFGLVALPERSGITTEHKPLGPANFLAYEMLTDPATADPFKADVYSLAKTLWVLAIPGQQFAPPGHQPASMRPYRIADQNPHRHAELLDQLVDGCTELDPARRPSMRGVAVELGAWLSLGGAAPALDVSQLAASYRATASAELDAAARREQLIDAFSDAVRHVEAGLRPLLDAIRQFDSRAELATHDKLTTNLLRARRSWQMEEPVKAWSRSAKLSSGASHHPYVLRLGRAVHAYENGTIAVSGLVNVGLDGVMMTDLSKTTEVRQAAGPADLQASIDALAAELAMLLQEALEIFVDRRRERGGT